MTVKELFDQIGVQSFQSVKWGCPVPCMGQGIYIVSGSAKADEENASPVAPLFDDAMIQRWIDRLPLFTLDGVKPTVESLKERLSEFWHPKENVLYIGMTTSSLQGRVSDYYYTPIGAKRPHSGGQWIKTLANLEQMHVYYAPARNQRRMNMLCWLIFSARLESFPLPIWKDLMAGSGMGCKSSGDSQKVWIV